MKKMLTEYLGTPVAFVLAFLLVGTPSAPAVVAVEAVADVSSGVGGCAAAQEFLAGPIPEPTPEPSPPPPPPPSPPPSDPTPCDSFAGMEINGTAIVLMAGVVALVPSPGARVGAALAAIVGGGMALTGMVGSYMSGC